MRFDLITSVLATLLLAGCVVPTGPVEVTRFNRAADGIVYGTGSFGVALSEDAKAADSLAASPYLASVAREMRRIGYQEGTGNNDVVARVDVRVDTRTAQKQSPVSVGVGGSTGSYGSGVGLGLGINLGGGPKAQVVTTLSVRIIRNKDKLVIWEGRATQSAGTSSPAAQPGIAASKLAESLFKDFPGQSGETINLP